MGLIYNKKIYYNYLWNIKGQPKRTFFNRNSYSPRKYLMRILGESLESYGMHYQANIRKHDWHLATMILSLTASLLVTVVCRPQWLTVFH